jgi:hypothetical protein
MLVWHYLYISKPNSKSHLACTFIAEACKKNLEAEMFSSNIHIVFICSNKMDLQNEEKHSDNLTKRAYILSHTCCAPHYTYGELNNRGIRVLAIKQEPHEHFLSKGGSYKFTVIASQHLRPAQTIHANKRANISLIELLNVLEF